MPRRESNLRSVVVDLLAPLDAFAVENPVLPGTPDVNFVEGWLELKSCLRWPTRSQTPLRVEHWTAQQRVRHVRRSRAGGRTYVLIELVESREYLLLEGGIAARILGTATRPELEAVALALWRGKAELKAGLLALLREPSLPHERAQD